MPKVLLDFEKIKTLISEGKSLPEIINATGYNKASVRSFMTREGLKCTKDGRGGNHRTKKLSPEKIKQAHAHVKALAIKHNGGDPDTAFVIGMITVQIEEYRKRIDKLTQAKNILA